MARTIIKHNEDIQNITFRNPEKLETWVKYNKKRGRPKFQWSEKALEEMWEDVQTQKPEYRNIKLDRNNEEMTNAVKQYAISLTTKK